MAARLEVGETERAAGIELMGTKTAADADKLQLQERPCSVRALVAEVADLLLARASEKGLAFAASVAADVPAVLVLDSTRFRQILISLTSNAIECTSHGSVNVLCEMEQSEGSAALLRITVKHGLGSTFSVRLPAAVGPEPSHPGPPGASLDAGAPQAERALPTGLRILLAEDGPDNRKVLGFMLRKLGVDTRIVENGQLALEAALEAAALGAPFSVILMDMQMPVLDGYAATTQLRERGYTGQILALTAHAMRGDRERCLDAGCDDYFTKPTTRGKIAAAIAEALERTEKISGP